MIIHGGILNGIADIEWFGIAIIWALAWYCNCNCIVLHFIAFYCVAILYIVLCGIAMAVQDLTQRLIGIFHG